FIFDADGDVGAESRRRLERHYGPLPDTLISLTGNGQHLWFRTDREIPSSIGKVGDHLDIRGEGGYVVAPPSIHPHGTRYRSVNNLPPAPAPSWLIELAVRRPIVLLPPKENIEAIITSASSAAYGLAALNHEIERLVLASSGSRNHALNRAAFCLHQLVAGEELHADVVQQRLIGAAEANGLVAENGLRAVQATINSGATAGLRHPRDRHGQR